MTLTSDGKGIQPAITIGHQLSQKVLFMNYWKKTTEEQPAMSGSPGN